MIVDNRKSMDFFRPVRSTDPLVDRPKAKPAPTVIRREKITSLPPALKQSPNAEKERDPFRAAKAPVYPSSVIVEEAVVSSRNITYFEEPKPKSETKRPISVPKKKEYVKEEVEEDLEFNEFDGEEDDWLESLKSEGFLAEDEDDEEDDDGEVEEAPLKLGKNVPKKSRYSFLDNSSILKSVKVEKRPLSPFTPKPQPEKKPTPSFVAPKKSKPVKTAKKEYYLKESRPSNKKGMPFWATILITVVLGIAAGVAVFVLIS